MINESNPIQRITLPKDVAEAIESIKSAFNGQAYSIDVIWSNAQNTPESDYGVIWRWITKEEGADGVPQYFNALVNGYDVEQTPEEKVQEYYKNLRNSCEGSFYWEQANVVEITLDLLGIAIEGVNA